MADDESQISATPSVNVDVSKLDGHLVIGQKLSDLAGIDTEALREAAEAVSQQDNDNAESYAYGTIIYKQDEVGKCMYILHEGSVGIYKNYGGVNELKTSDVTPVACFGEMGLLSEKARDTTAVAETDNTSVEIIRAEDLEGLFKTSPAKIELILKNLSFRLRNLNYDYFKACKEIYEASKEEDRRY